MVIFNCHIVFILYLCGVKRYLFCTIAAFFLLLTGCQEQATVDPLRRSRVDGLNREAFVNRYRDPALCIDLSQQALQYIADSLPEYVDGELRALNNMAFAYYQKSDRSNANLMLDRVDKTIGLRQKGMRNGDIEWVIHDLLEARLLQRDCRIADSYRLLHDIEHSGVLRRNRRNMLFDYAQSEYYITSLVLNFHYRDGREADVRTLLDEAEATRAELKVDYAQDMALNYAMAYGWQSAGESTTALKYCNDNLRLLELPGAFCLYHYANTVQMMALALKSMPGTVPPDSVLFLYNEAREAFFDYGDFYQMLGGTTSTARYALLTADTAVAHKVLAEWMEAVQALRNSKGGDGQRWIPFSAPKMELSLFDVLIRSRYPASDDDLRRWYSHYADLQEYIRQNEREDFALQQTLASATRRSHWMSRTAIAMGAMTLALAVLSVLLWLSIKRLRREKRQLEEAKRRDVERIANVETCLSVLRHDVSPFMGYLSRPGLDPAVRDEVLGQLLRTFDNIKSWTRLSVPSGLTFHASHFDLQEVFDDVSRQSVQPAAGVVLRFADTNLTVYGDRLLATIMLRNLVNNALQHTTAGSVTVTAAPAPEANMVDIAVSDTGSGMSAEQRDSLFRADRTLPEGSEHGFGLILCRYIIGKHDDLTRRGCKLWVESEPGRGTTVHARLAAV